MPERSALATGVQIGVETTEGTSVAANKQLQALGIAASIQLEAQRFRPMGTKFDTLVTPGKEWVEADLEGQATYDEIIYPLSSILVATTPSVTGTTGQQWTFTPSSTAADTVKTFTVEIGDTVRAHKFTGGKVTEFGLTWNRDGVELSGTMLGQAITDGITMTAAPTSVPMVPILPATIDVYADNTGAGIGTTKLLRVLEGEFSIGNRFSPLWVLNSANASYVATVESEPDATFRILVEADAAGMGLLTTMRAGSTKFFEVRATGGTIGAGPATYSAFFQFAVKIEEIGDFSDEDGVYAIEYTGRLVHDATWGKAMNVIIVNSTTAL